MHLHKTSRQHSKYCGIDVTVAGTGRAAEQTTQTLASLASGHDAESPLARVNGWKPPLQHERIKIEVARRCTNQLKDILRRYVSGMQKFLRKPKAVKAIKKVLWNGHVYLGKTDKAVNLPKAMEASSCAADATHKLITFLYVTRLKSTAEGFVATNLARATHATQATAAVAKHGTPVRLLQLLFQGLEARLASYNGSMCKRVHVPNNWDNTLEPKRETVVLNVWGNHIFIYDNPQARNPKVDMPPYYVKARVQTLMDVEDRILFTEAQQLDQSLLQQAWGRAHT